jgi:hypothetical protein
VDDFLCVADELDALLVHISLAACGGAARAFDLFVLEVALVGHWDSGLFGWLVFNDTLGKAWCGLGFSISAVSCQQPGSVGDCFRL